MSQLIPTGYMPSGNPWGLAQKTCRRGQDLTFESCKGAENSTKAGILWKIKLKLQKIAWIKFLQVKTKKKQVEFFTFFEVYCMCFFNSLIFPGLWVILWFYCHTYLTKNLRSCRWLVYLKFTLGYSYPHPLFA